MDNVHTLPFNAASQAQLLAQIARDYGEDIEQVVVIFKRKSDGQTIIAVGADEKRSPFEFLASSAVILQDFAMSIIKGVKGMPG